MKDVEARFDTSNWELDRPLPKETEQKKCGINEKGIGWKKKWKSLPLWDQAHIVIYQIITIKLKKQTALNAPKGDKDTKSNSTWKWNQTK